jgi:NADH-quinone oxidoreductase subunit H
MIYNACDFVKLIVKERFDPKFASSFGYYAAGPFIPLIVALIVPAFIPMFAPIAYQTAEGSLAALAGTTISTHSGLLALFAFSSLSVYGIVLGSWASNSKFSLLGGMRSSAMMISYEVSIGLAAAGMFLIVGSFDLARIVAWQGEHTWGIVAQPLGFLLFTVAMFAECNRNPFDVVEGESEIVAGFHTEYGAMRFMLIMSAEYYHVIIAAALISTLFLGGYHLSPVPLPVGPDGALQVLDDQWMRSNLGMVCAVMLGGGALVAAFAAKLVNGRRVHYSKSGASDAAMRAKEYVLYTAAFGGLALLLAGAAVALLVVGWHPQPHAIVGQTAVWGWKVDLVTAVVQFHVLVGKILLVSWLFVWVRWTLPRFRYDQIMALGWKVLLNAALINLLITAIIVKLVS